METVLGLLTRTDETTAALLSDALRARGARLVLLYTETFPTDTVLDATLGPQGYRGRLTTQDGETIDLSEIRSIWLRRWDVGIDLRRHELDPSVGFACRRESEAVLRGVLTSLSAPMVNDMYAAERAEVKVWQLAQAARVGLTLPETLFTNRPGSGAAFGGAHGALITKRMATTRVRASSGARHLMNTAAVEPSDLIEMDGGLSLSPVTLQGRIPKALEARASVVGDRVFASAVDSQAVSGAEVDWRIRSPELMERFQPIVLPDAVVHKLTALHRSLGLQYGGADLICTPEGQWVFLETNPSGEWDWIHHSGHDVAGALADLLLAAR